MISKEELKLKVEQGLSINDLMLYFDCKKHVINNLKKKYGLIRHKITFNKEDMIYLLDKNYTVKMMADYFKCGKSSIEARKKKWGLTKYISKYIDIDKESLIKHINNNLTNSELAKVYNCDIKTISNKKSLYKLNKKPLNIDTNILINLNSKGYTNKELAEEFKCSVQPIKDIKNIFNIKSLNNKLGSPTHINNPTAGFYGSMSKYKADSLYYSLFVYIVKLQFEDETFYKIGLTKNKSRVRYRGYTPYKVIDELIFDEYNAWDAILEEKDLHIFFKDKSYIPKHKFGGWSECFKGII